MSISFKASSPNNFNGSSHLTGNPHIWVTFFRHILYVASYPQTNSLTSGLNVLPTAEMTTAACPKVQNPKMTGNAMAKAPCDMIALSPEASFSFACNPGVPCFNACCRDLSQFLTPYDVLRLKRCLDLTSGEFLGNFTAWHIGPGSGLPVVTLRPVGGSQLRCPFVTPQGCSVYPDRPAACRTYPLVRLVSRDRESGHTSERFFLLKEPHCQGHLQARKQTVREWLCDQDLAAYNRMNDLLMAAISLKNRLAPGPLPLTLQRLFYQACYDQDAFRALVREKRLTRPAAVDTPPLERLESDDDALLAFALDYWQKALADHAARHS
jgi:Fe-S-cluster containining protein